MFLVVVPLVEIQLGWPLWLVLVAGGGIAVVVAFAMSLLLGGVATGVRYLVQRLRREPSGRDPV